MKGRMMGAEVFKAETKKSVDDFVKDLASAAARRGYFIHNESKMNMAHTFGRHGVEVAKGFDLHVIQFCKPQRSSQCLGSNPERAILMPKFVVTFSRNGKTHIRFLNLSREMVGALIEDAEFPDIFTEISEEIVTMIREAA